MTIAHRHKIRARRGGRAACGRHAAILLSLLLTLTTVADPGPAAGEGGPQTWSFTREGIWCTADAAHYSGCRVTIAATLTLAQAADCIPSGCGVAVSYEVNAHTDRYVGFPTGIVSVSGFVYGVPHGSLTAGPGEQCGTSAPLLTTLGADAFCASTFDAFLKLPSYPGCIELHFDGNADTGSVQRVERMYESLQIFVCKTTSGSLTMRASDEAPPLPTSTVNASSSRYSATCGGDVVEFLVGDPLQNCPTSVTIAAGASNEDCISSGCSLSFAGKMVARRAVMTTGTGIKSATLFTSEGSNLCDAWLTVEESILTRREIACVFSTQEFIFLAHSACKTVRIGSTSQGWFESTDFDEQFVLEVCRTAAGGVSSIELRPLPA